MELGATGPRRTKGAYYKDCPKAVARRNAIRRLLEKMTGGRRRVAALSAEVRAAIRGSALALYESGQLVEHIAGDVAAVTRDGFVYIVSNPAFPGFVKIGCAIDACSRLNTFQTACPFRAYTLEHAVYTSDRFASEALVHFMLVDRRVNGEWFHVPVETAREALESVREFDPRAFGIAA